MGGLLSRGHIKKGEHGKGVDNCIRSSGRVMDGMERINGNLFCEMDGRHAGFTDSIRWANKNPSLKMKTGTSPCKSMGDNKLNVQDASDKKKKDRRWSLGSIAKK